MNPYTHSLTADDRKRAELLILQGHDFAAANRATKIKSLQDMLTNGMIDAFRAEYGDEQADKARAMIEDKIAATRAEGRVGCPCCTATA